MIDNKWTLEIKDNYTLNGKTITRTQIMAIPPTSGDRTDIIGESGKYYQDMKKSKFMERISREEYLEESLPGLEGKDKEHALKNIDWTPRRLNDNIAILIEIKKGEITIKGK